MPSLLASILRNINRQPNTKLNILTINYSETYQTALAKTGHNFFFMYHPKLRPWDSKIRPVPQNCHLWSGNDVSSQFRYDVDFDLILCQNRIEQYPILQQIARQLACSMINIEYSLSSPEANSSYIESLTYQPYNFYIFSSEFIANSWGFDIEDETVKIIPHGIDTEFFGFWTGGDNKVLTVVKDYQRRNNIMDFDLYKEVIAEFQPNPHGASPGFSKATNDFDELLKIYQNASVFLNTSSWHGCPLALLEAMSVGCPIVTTGTASIGDIIEDGVNGFITDDAETMKSKIKQIIEDQELGKQLGEKARLTILEKFHTDEFLNNWEQIFKLSADQPSSAIVE